MIAFHKPLRFKESEECLLDAYRNHALSGGGKYTRQCEELLSSRFPCAGALMVPSGTAALELAALLCDLNPGDEVIMPSFTFPSTANAFVHQKAKPVFVDISPDTQNIDAELIENAITTRTRVIVPVHYAGVSCDMDRIMAIAQRHHLLVVEDAAQGIGSSWHGRPLGSIGDFGCLSFHDTKNLTMGEGGALLVRDDGNLRRAEIIREKGTDRAAFLRGEINRYSWVDEGYSAVPNELGCAMLLPQLYALDELTARRRMLWERYYDNLLPLAEQGRIAIPVIPTDCAHNAHIFYLKTKDKNEREMLRSFLAESCIQTVSHFVPLHSSGMGLQCARFHGEDRYTTDTASCLLRLPLYDSLSEREADIVCEAVHHFYRTH